MTHVSPPQVYSDFVELVAVSGRGRLPGAAPPSRGSIVVRSLWRAVPLLALVALPTGLATAYFGFFASDRYESQSRFVVRSPSRSAVSMVSGILSSTGESRASDDAHAVNAFIQSRDAALMLADKHELKALWSVPEADRLMRYPRLFHDATEEELFRLYEKLVSIQFDTSTGISTLSVQAFRPEDAVRVSNALLQAAERLINRLNERSHADAVESARREIEAARTRADEALDELTRYRNRESITDPGRLSATIFEVVGRLTFERAKARAQLSEMERNSPQTVQLAGIRNRITALDTEILRERQQLAGSDGSLAPRLAEYERLVLHREFADRSLTSAMHSMEAARMEALRQQLYLERIVEPRAADYARYPSRLLWPIVTFCIGIAAYLSCRAMARNARKHGLH